jgi:predicted Fe-S protein YdhL (DUF1289 family)
MLDTIESPCIGVCSYGETTQNEKNSERICSGCGRTAEEITEWYKASNERKLEIKISAEKRKVT